jgi:hypothetical protein
VLLLLLVVLGAAVAAAAAAQHVLWGPAQVTHHDVTRARLVQQLRHCRPCGELQGLPAAKFFVKLLLRCCTLAGAAAVLCCEGQGHQVCITLQG